MPSTLVAVGRRERKKQATRHALAEAAWRLTRSQGLDRTTVEQVADAADVSSRTFFNHFSCKEEAVVAALVSDQGELVEAFRARPADEHPLDSVLAAMVARLTPEQAEHWRAMTELTETSPTLLAHLLAAVARNEQTLVDAVAERTGTDPDRDHYARLVCRTASAAMRCVQERWAMAGCSGPVEELLAEVRHDLAHDLRPPAR